MFFCFATLAQSIETIYIEVKTDEHPEEISWSLSNENGEALIEVDDEIDLPNRLYTWSFQVLDSDCIRFDIFDKAENGIDSTGYYRLRRENIWYQGDQLAFSDNNFHYTGRCTVGQTCENPLPVTSRVMYTSGRKDFWFELSSENSNNFMINTCSSFNTRNSKTIDTQIWIYDGCPRELYDGPEGALAVNDTYVSCAPGSGIFGYPIQKGRKYIIRIRNNDSDSSQVLAITFEADDEIKGCMDPTSCNYNPFANIDDNSCIYEECLPDLEVGYDEFISSIVLDCIHVEDPCLLEESCVTGVGNRHVIRFTTAIYNRGNADYVVGNPQIDSRGFSIDNCHGHWHRLGYAEYLLYQKGGVPLPLGFKNGFCLFDLSCQDKSKLSKYSCEFMGISAGCFDVYDSSIDCQWLDITDVPDGEYTLVLRVNWNRLPDQRGLSESTFENNLVQACIEIDRTSGNLKLKVKEDCPEYTDCFGEKYGSAVVDCNGICGGLAHFGDIDGDGELTSLDLLHYQDVLEQGENQPTSCIDLNNDGRLSLYDLALAQQCIASNSGNNLFHNHCIFPISIENQDGEISFRMVSHDQGAKEIEIEYSSNTPIMGFQLSIDGIENIIELKSENFNLAFHDRNQNLFFIHGLRDTNQNLQDGKFTIIYDTTTTDSVCVGQVQDVIAQDFSFIQNKSVIEGCDFTTSLLSNQPEYSGLSFSPNPVTHQLNIDFHSVSTRKIEILNTQGIIVKSINIRPRRSLSIDVGHLRSGLYFIRTFNSEQGETRKFIKN